MVGSDPFIMGQGFQAVNLLEYSPNHVYERWEERGSTMKHLFCNSSRIQTIDFVNMHTSAHFY